MLATIIHAESKQTCHGLMDNGIKTLQLFIEIHGSIAGNDKSGGEGWS
jgi:hypothetical protein